ncbi:Enoyl-CoA hydratase [Phaffia rhodozyma]|uniref:Probable enoyl-CoA hydratase, mitochondrial n=1 Tax=Phaffia rhodozyma TaxID=264483 RepID=A0A0F7SL02_PHARH|nr:Enoyl-CoA hydratase [Phaffia rhodozyma]
MSSLVLCSRQGKVTLLKLNRPKELNALNSALIQSLNEELDKAAADQDVGCVVITGEGGKAFAAGADIKEMQSKTLSEVYNQDFLTTWTKINSFRKPIIGAINGFALGGGCELAMMTDILLASPHAKFGQPEINLGIIPGAGGTQRLIRAIGKSRAMEYILTGNMFTAEQASEWGLISRVVPDKEGDAKGQGVVDAAIEMGKLISEKGGLSVIAAKEAVNIAEETSLNNGLAYERKLFHSLFATHDQKEGMTAFVEKRAPNFKNQ